MPEVNVEINGRKYRMACEPGQEQHLQTLADRYNQSIDGLKGTFGEIGDNRLTVMAGIASSTSWSRPSGGSRSSSRTSPT